MSEESGIVLPEIVQRVGHLAQRRVGEETVVLDLRESRVFGFNAEGGELLEAIKEPRRTAALCASSAERGSKVKSFLAELLALGLVESGAAPSASEETAERPWVDPRLLWREDVARVTNQISPPQAITNPQCQP